MLDSRKMGWIGVDIGTSSVKLVQLVRDQGSVRIAASAVVARRDAWPLQQLAECDAKSSVDELGIGKSLQRGFRGNRVAASLPMALSDVHVLQTTLASEENSDRIVRQAIETATQRSADALLCDHWTAEPAQEAGNPGRTNVLTVPTTWSDQLCQDIAQAGWSCELIDGLPFALARAVTMLPDSSGLVAALDLGFGRATFCIVEAGQPIYVRLLKRCGLQRMLSALSENLNLSVQEAQQLLQEHGLPVAAMASEPRDEKAHLIAEVVAAPLAQLEQEIARSLEHFQAQRRRGDSIRLCLFGGGASIRNLEQHLARSLKTKVDVWRLQHDQTQQEPAIAESLLGPAIALSALAWEAP